MDPGTIAAIFTVLIVSSVDGILAGGGTRGKMAAVRQPRFSPPFAVWAVFQWLYYGLCCASAYGLASVRAFTPSHALATGLLLAMILCNGWWNYLFFRAREFQRAWRFALGYTASAFALAVVMIYIDKELALLFLVYALFLVFGAWWSYSVWHLNT